MKTELKTFENINYFKCFIIQDDLGTAEFIKTLLPGNNNAKCIKSTHAEFLSGIDYHILDNRICKQYKS